MGAVSTMAERVTTTFVDLAPADWRQAFFDLGLPPFRGSQVAVQVYHRLAPTYAAMTDLPRSLRQELEERLPLGMGQEVAVQAADGGVVKALLKFAGEASAECVLLPYHYGTSACLSSQVGCRQGCVFCATGASGFSRSLRAGEMMAQYLTLARKAAPERVSRVVMMGAGEPLDNYQEVLEFLRRLNDPATFGVSFRRMTISTVGLVPEIDRLAGERLPVRLALSLHATTDEVRSLLIPENRRYPIAQILAAADRYAEASGRRVTYEFILIGGLTDQDDEAHRLAALVGRHPGHVNLIPLNPTSHFPYQRPSGNRVRAFADILQAAGVATTVRRTMGQEVDAACGQLRRRYDQRGDLIAPVRVQSAGTKSLP
ncbi:MAG: 23S rRNA (adenine(2503)-C(2))-methyltransferase RlmN [Sulfobacillus sp.]